MQTSFYCTDWVSAQLACTCPLTSAQEWRWLILQLTFERWWEIWNSVLTRLEMPPTPTYTHTPRFTLSTSFRAAALHLWDRMSVKDHYRRFSIEKCAKKGDLPQLECIFYLLPVCRGATMTSYTYHIWTKISLHINTMLKTTFLPISVRIVQIS